MLGTVGHIEKYWQESRWLNERLCAHLSQRQVSHQLRTINSSKEVTGTTSKTETENQQRETHTNQAAANQGTPSGQEKGSIYKILELRRLREHFRKLTGSADSTTSKKPAAQNKACCHLLQLPTAPVPAPWPGDTRRRVRKI